MGSPPDRFGATVGIELGEDRRDMELGRVERDSSRRAITLLEAPSAMAASTSCSRGVSETRLAPSSRRDSSEVGELASSSRSRT